MTLAWHSTMGEWKHDIRVRKRRRRQASRGSFDSLQESPNESCWVPMRYSMGLFSHNQVLISIQKRAAAVPARRQHHRRSQKKKSMHAANGENVTTIMSHEWVILPIECDWCQEDESCSRYRRDCERRLALDTRIVMAFAYAYVGHQIQQSLGREVAHDSSNGVNLRRS
jgi:hypothetical protein